MSHRIGVAAAGVALIALTLAPGCAPAEAKPLDVTYYYLPG